MSSTENADAGGYKFGDAPTGAHRAPGPRIALLTPYNGGNLGDAAIQDALIHNLQVRLPGCQFSGITLNGGNFTQRHGARSFPYANVQTLVLCKNHDRSNLSGQIRFPAWCVFRFG